MKVNTWDTIAIHSRLSIIGGSPRMSNLKKLMVMDLETAFQKYFQSGAYDYMTFDEFIGSYIDSKVEA